MKLQDLVKLSETLEPNYQSIEFKEGKEAYADGNSEIHCTYPKGSQNYIDWMAGYNAAKEEDQD